MFLEHAVTSLNIKGDLCQHEPTQPEQIAYQAVNHKKTLTLSR